MYEKVLNYIVNEKRLAFKKLEDVLLSYENGVIDGNDYDFEVKFTTRTLQVYKDLILDRFGKDLTSEQYLDIINLFQSYFVQITIVYVLREEKMA